MKPKTFCRAALTIVVSGALFFGLASAQVEENLTYQGNKARITVGKIKPKAKKCSNDIAAAIGEMLSTALTNNPKFIVLASQEEVDELIDEIELGKSGYVEEGRGPEQGLMEGADLLVTGAVTAFEPDAGGSGGGIGGLKKKAFGKIGVKTKSAKVIMDLKLVDIRTRRVLKATSIEAKSTSWGTDVAGGGWADDMVLAGGLGVYSNQPMEKAVRTLLVKTVDEVSKEVPDEYYRYKGGGQYSQQYGGQQTTPAGQPPAASGAASQNVAAANTPPAAPAAEDMTLYTKYDFIPGDKVIFYDDMANDEVGEFPYRWNLDEGVYEVAKLGGELWILATDDGNIRPKIPNVPLPEQYTVEYEYYNNGPEQSGNYHYLFWVDANGRNIGCFGIYGDRSTWLALKGKTIADKDLPAKPGKGPHVMRIMATSRSVKCYVDNVRVANVPKIDGFQPTGFRLHHRPYNNPDNPVLFRGFRFAEGGKSMREQLDETGKIVTHGILFDKGSHVIKGESYKTLQQIGELLTDDATLRLSINGHTDSDGEDTYNLDLSKQRAESVRNYLISKFGVTADRLECKGFGETEPIDSNGSPEGKANNRRVELVKI
jgi:outer membrane protein OmpA-like peptidoglycan-associated protein/curli biogenesis system outer membrane secretion channel CsgG